MFLYFCKDMVLSHGAKKRAKQSGGSIPQPKTSERETEAKKEEPYKNAPRLGLSVGRVRLEGRGRRGGKGAGQPCLPRRHDSILTQPFLLREEGAHRPQWLLLVQRCADDRKMA